MDKKRNPYFSEENPTKEALVWLGLGILTGWATYDWVFGWWW